jgi:hypothetical protein
MTNIAVALRASILSLVVLAGAERVAVAEAPNACDLLSAADVKALLRQPAEPHKVGWVRYAAICGWQGKTTNLSILLETDEILRDYKATNPSSPMKSSAAEQFDSAKAEQKRMNPLPVQGIGDRAFWSKTSKALWVFKNNKTVVISINRKKASGSANDIEAAKAAARIVTAKL